MHQTHFIEFLISLGFLAAMMWGMLKFMLRDIHKDLADIHKDLAHLKEGQYRFELKMEKTELRIDHLYEENNRLYKILIEMVKK